MDIRSHLGALRSDGELLGEAAAVAGLDAPVPSCPDWTVRDLVRHTGMVHRWAGSHVARRSASENDADETFPPDDELLTWYAEGHAWLVDTLTGADPDLACWHFLPAASGTRFWARRQAHETAIHRVDAQLAAGIPVTAFDPAFAADGVDEVLYAFFARRPSRLRSTPPLTFGLVAADLGESWRTEIGAEGATTTPSAAPATGAVRAPAHDLYLLLWNRRDLDGLAVTGDPGGIAYWREHARITW